MTIFNTINEVEEQLIQIETNSGKIEFLKQQQNLKRYALKKMLTVADLTETKTGRIFKGLNEFDDKLIEMSLKHDEVLRFIEIELEYLEALPPHQTETETKTDKLKRELGKYGFFELSKVKQLSEPNKQSLIELISTNGLPYSIAMFDFLNFLKHLETEHFTAKYKLNKEVAKWLNSDKEGRAVKGNISSLSDFSAENKSKYTAHIHKESVKTDYQKLK